MLVPLEFEPMENSHKETNGCQMGVKKSAFIPSKLGRENYAGLLSHTLESNLSTQ